MTDDLENHENNDGFGRNTPYEALASTAWQASYSVVLAGRAGEAVEATARIEDWRERPGWTWRWCRDARGREGWVPTSLLLVAGTTTTLREDYDASELTMAAGARLMVEREAAGWALCNTADGTRGWVPLECLTGLDRSSR